MFHAGASMNMTKSTLVQEDAAQVPLYRMSVHDGEILNVCFAEQGSLASVIWQG